MKDLKNYRRLKVFFFGDEEQKKQFYIDCICPFMEKEKKGCYYAVRDWNGGPNVEVVYKGKPIDRKKVKRWVASYVRQNNIKFTTEEIEKNLSSYIKNQSNILVMERKDEIKIDASNHLCVSDCYVPVNYYKRVYNSSEHVCVHFESRFILQPIIEETLRSVTDKDSLRKIVMKLFQITMQMFDYGEKYGSMMYFSNINGVFAIAGRYGKEDAFRKYFEAEYKKMDLSDFDNFEIGKSLIEKYRNAWGKIHCMCVKLVKEKKLSEEGYFTLEDQEQLMISNTKGVDSEFHKAMMADEKLHEVVSNDLHLIFRSISNILYSVLPALNITFMEKQFCCYAIISFIMEKYDTTWQQIAKERKIN